MKLNRNRGLKNQGVYIILNRSKKVTKENEEVYYGL